MRRILLASDGLGALPAFLGGDPRGLRVAYVPTAGAHAKDPSWWVEERARLRAMGLALVEVDLDALAPDEAARRLAQADALHLSGGKAYHLLARMRATGFDALVRRFADEGGPIVGVSAGAIVLGPDAGPVGMFQPADMVEALGPDTRGLGLVEVTVLPHADQPRRAEAYIEIEREWGERVRLERLRDDEALALEGGRLRRVASP